MVLGIQNNVYYKTCTWVYVFLPGCRAITSCYANTLSFMCEFLTVILCVHFLTKLSFSMLTSAVVFNLFPTIWVCEPSLLTGCWLETRQCWNRLKHPEPLGRHRGLTLMYHGPSMASTNKVVTPLNSVFSFSALLKQKTAKQTTKPPLVF